MKFFDFRVNPKREFFRISCESAGMLLELIVGLDGDRKMSKSLNNCIYISDSEKKVNKKVGGMFTDPKRIRADIPGTVEGNPVFEYHDAFNPDLAEIDDLKDRYRKGAVGDVEVKQKLAKSVNAILEPFREKRADLEKRPDDVRDILKQGTAKANECANENIEEIIKKTGLFSP